MENKQQKNRIQQPTGEWSIKPFNGSELNTRTECGFYHVTITHDNLTKAGLPAALCSEEHDILGFLLIGDNNSEDKRQKDRSVFQTLIVKGCNTLSANIYSRSCRYSDGVPEWSAWESFASLSELDSRVTAGKEVVWDASSRIDSFVESGVYSITGERLNVDDGLPIDNCAPGHTINARLTVLDSSISGSGESDDKCVTQILTLSNRTGGDGDVYIRTGSAASKNQLTGGSGWEQWSKLQQNVQVGQVTSLNVFTGNGMYSGVYTDGSTFFETFVMVVINNYAVAGANGKVRSVSQFKYALALDGTFSYKSRSGQGNTGISWGEWSDLNGATTAMLQDGAVTAQKLSADVREKVNNPLRPLFIAAGAEYNDTGVDKTKTAPWGETVTHKAGHYYLNGLGDITEEQMMEIYNYKDAIYRLGLSRAYEDSKFRTVIGIFNYDSISSIPTMSYSSFLGNDSLETFLLHNAISFDKTSNTQRLKMPYELNHSFYGCKKLVCIHPLDVNSTTKFINVFYNCLELKEVRFYGTKADLSLLHSSKISKKSIMNIVENATPSSAITITLHPDAYARLADDADIVSALEAQPLVSLVSA